MTNLVKNLRIFLIAILCLFSLRSVAQHPRVAELEDKYKSEARDYLKSRFPEMAFSVLVKVEPLRRLSGDYQPKGEQLPFYSLDDEEIRDEWDDPTASLYSLSQRVKKVELKIQAPSEMSEREVAEMEKDLASVLRLVPSRDQIEIKRRQWSLSSDHQYQMISGVTVVLVLLLGLYLILRVAVLRVSSSLGELQTSLSQGSNAQPPPPPRSSSVPAGEGPLRKGGDLQFNDPIRTREVIGKRVEDLEEQGDLLRLENMVKLDKLGKMDPKSLGALIMSFPADDQKKLLALSAGTHWMEAFSYPGEPNLASLEIMEEICRAKTTTFRAKWEQLLIQVWRLGELRGQFLRGLPLNDALAILCAMPKFISVPTARSTFPGNWAAVVDPDYQPETIREERCHELNEQAEQMVPPVNFEILESYKKMKELLIYLKEADPQEEREVYAATISSGLLSTMRPPFFPLFEQSEEIIQKMVVQYSLDDWALALFNVPRDQRKVVVNYFSDKERFLFLEQLKYLDTHKPDLDVVGQVREQMARDLAFHITMAQMNELPPQPIKPTMDQTAQEDSEEDQDDEKVA